MEISYAFFAEAAQLMPDGRLNILGADLHTLQFQGPSPWHGPTMSLLVSLRLQREECGQLYRFVADLIAPGGRALEPHIENDFVAPVLENPDTVGQMNIVLQMQGVSFPEAGVYHMHVRVEDQERRVVLEKRIRLRVTDAVPQPQPA